MNKEILAHMSVNQFVEFSKATESKRKQIVKQQLKADKLLVNWYQGAKAGMRRYLTNVNDLYPLEAELDKQKGRVASTKHQKLDREVSIQALQRLIGLNLSRHLGLLKYEVVKTEIKSIIVNKVKIAISPEVILKVIVNGKTVYGGVKIHICKSKPFDLQQCNYVAVLLHDYLINLASEGESVLPQFCLCIDVFGGRIVSAKEDHFTETEEINNVCEDVIKMWPVAA